MTYSQKLDRVKSDAPVSFERGPVRGSSRGLVYESRSGLITLPSEVEVQVLPAEKHGHILRIRSGRLKFHKHSGEVELHSNVRVEKGPTELTAAEMRAFFTMPAWDLSHIEARGQVRSRSLHPGTMIEVQADRLRYLFGAQPDGLDKVVALGKALARPLTPQSLRELSAREITVVFPPRSQSIRSLTAVGEARARFLTPSPSQAGTPPGALQTSGPHNGVTRRILTSPPGERHLPARNRPPLPGGGLSGRAPWKRPPPVPEKKSDGCRPDGCACSTGRIRTDCSGLPPTVR